MHNQTLGICPCTVCNADQDDAKITRAAPITFLIPTDQAWLAALQSLNLTGFEGYERSTVNSTTMQNLTDVEAVLLRGAGLAAVMYNQIQGVALTTANATDGQSFPTVLDEEANITVHVDPITRNISFTGGQNSTHDATAANSSAVDGVANRANVLFADIPVNGTVAVVMHVTDKVLQPPQDVLLDTAEGLAVGLLVADYMGDDDDD